MKVGNQMQTQILLLGEGTEHSKGKEHILSNIDACCEVVNIVKTTLGPRGMDKLFMEGDQITITNDGATVLDLLEVSHPAAQTLVEIAKSQDKEVGDGTTSVVVLTGEILDLCRIHVEENVHPNIICQGLQRGLVLALERLDEVAIKIDTKTPDFKQSLRMVAETALNSKLIQNNKVMFGEMIVDAVTKLHSEAVEISNIVVRKVSGGSVEDSFIVDGLAFKKTFSYAGFENQPKKILNAKVALLKIELELKREKENAEIEITDVKDYQKFVDTEWSLFHRKLELLKDVGATVVLSDLSIGDIATQYFADHNIFAAGRVSADELKRISVASGKPILSTLTGITSENLTICESLEEIQVGNERYNILKGILLDNRNTHISTIVVRGGALQFLEETARSLHDSLMVTSQLLKYNEVVGGAGAVELELSRFLKEKAILNPDSDQFFIEVLSKALEVIPHQICTNSGFNATEIIWELKKRHHENPIENLWLGVDTENGGILDSIKHLIWETKKLKVNILNTAIDAACSILSADETIKAATQNTQ